jgi:arylsulfatase A-like enzyme
MRTLLYCILCVGWTSACWAQPMNLLIIQTDEHNFRTLGCYRELMPESQALVWGPKATVDTPHIDSIAHRGAICTSFYATSPVCTPSRASLVSGRYPQNTGAPTNNLPMLLSVVTFAQRLADRGYATGFAGKWHLDGNGKPQWQPERNFGFADNRFMFNRGHWKQLELTTVGPRVKARDAKGNPSYGIQGADATSFTTDWLTDRTLEFLEAHQSQPFCFMVSIPDPHGPNTVRAPYDTMFDPQLFSQPRTFDQTRDQTPRYLGAAARRFSGEGMAKYFGMVKCIDDNVGRILSRLDELGIVDRTAIVFTSDHGDLCGEHHRDNKGNPYEASARVPFLLTAPSRVPAGTVLHQAMAGVDFTPTIMSLLEQQPAGQALEGVEGRDLSQLFITGKQPADFEDVIFMRRAGQSPGWVAAISDRYKLVLSPQDEPWLFDLVQDPDELTNFYDSAKHAAVVRKLANRLADYGPAHQESSLREPKMVSDLAAAQAKGL